MLHSIYTPTHTGHACGFQRLNQLSISIAVIVYRKTLQVGDLQNLVYMLSMLVSIAQTYTVCATFPKSTVFVGGLLLLQCNVLSFLLQLYFFHALNSTVKW